MGWFKTWQENRTTKKLAKYESKTAIKTNKHNQKTAWVDDRQKSKQTAYENGIDPNKWISDSVGHVGDATSNIFGQNAGGFLGSANDTLFGTGNEAPSGSGGGLDLKKMFPLLALGGLAYFMTKKK